MQKSILLSLFIFVMAFTINAQNEIMYIMKDGFVVGQYNVNTEIDSVIFYKPTLATSGTFTDTRDNTVYKWVIIGNQVWMAENLKFLPEVVGPKTGSSSDPYYYVFDFHGTDVAEAKATSNYQIHGAMYNWPAAMGGEEGSTGNPSGVQGVCPAGWHLPSDAEWTELTDYLGGVDIAGSKLKATGTLEAGTGLWMDPNSDATNESGFSAIPGGYRDGGNQNFYGILNYCYWWSATDGGGINAIYRYIYHKTPNVRIDNYRKETAFSVRCVRN